MLNQLQCKSLLIQFLLGLAPWALSSCGIIKVERHNYRSSASTRSAAETQRGQVLATNKEPYPGQSLDGGRGDWFIYGPDDKESGSSSPIEGANIEKSFHTYQLAHFDLAEVVVAVLDGGLDLEHEDLKDHLWTNSKEKPNGADDDGNGLVDDLHGWNFLDNNNQLSGGGAFHGTHVAGIIAANRNNSKGIKGVTSNVRIMVLKIVPEDGDETDANVARAVRYAADQGARIINMSFGKYQSDDYQSVYQAMIYAAEKKVFFVQSSGNDSVNLDDQQLYPNRPLANNQDLIDQWLVVGASGVSKKEILASFSNYSKNNVDLFAPGVDILSLYPGNKYSELSGTSMAAPVVTGVAAIVWGTSPGLEAKALKKLLVDSTRKYAELSTAKGKFSELSSSGGIVDLYQALRAASQ